MWEDNLMPNQFLLFAVEKEVTTWAEVVVWVMCLLLGYWFKKKNNNNKHNDILVQQDFSENISSDL